MNLLNLTMDKIDLVYPDGRRQLLLPLGNPENIIYEGLAPISDFTIFDGIPIKIGCKTNYILPMDESGKVKPCIVSHSVFKVLNHSQSNVFTYDEATTVNIYHGNSDLLRKEVRLLIASRKI